MEIKAISCIVGAVLINLTLGTFYAYGNVSPYLASYMRNNGNPGVVSEDATWITSAFLLGQGLFLIVGAYIEQLTNNRVACIVGCVLHCVSTFLTLWAINTSMLTVVLFYGFTSGLGCGSSYIACIIAAQKWNPHKKGLYTGIIVAGFGFGGLIFSFLQTLYVNPNNVAPDDQGYFGEEIYNRVPGLFRFMGIIFTLMQASGCILSFPPPSDPSVPAPENSAGQGPTQVVDEALPNMRSLTSAFKYRVFYVIGAMMMTVAPGVTVVNSLGKRYGQTMINDDKFLSTAVALAAIANAGGRLTWGFLTDKFSFSICFTLKVALFVVLIALFPFEFVLGNKTLYMIWMLGLFFGFSGTFVLFPLFIEQVFGSKFHGAVYGILYLALATSSIATSFIIKVFIDVKGSSAARIILCEFVAFLYVISLLIYRSTLSVDRLENAVKKRKEANLNSLKHSLTQRRDLFPLDGAQKENSLGSIVRFTGPP